MTLQKISPKVLKRFHYSVGLLFILISASISDASPHNEIGEFVIRYSNGGEGDGRWTYITITNSGGSYFRCLPNERVLPRSLTITDEKKRELVNFIISTDFFSLKNIIKEDDDCFPAHRRMDFSIKINEKEHNVSTIYCSGGFFGGGFFGYCDAIRNKTIKSICNKMFNIIAPTTKRIRNHKVTPEELPPSIKNKLQKKINE
jgi:hypothetical protein